MPLLADQPVDIEPNHKKVSEGHLAPIELDLPKDLDQERIKSFQEVMLGLGVHEKDSFKLGVDILQNTDGHDLKVEEMVKEALRQL